MGNSVNINNYTIIMGNSDSSNSSNKLRSKKNPMQSTNNNSSFITPGNTKITCGSDGSLNITAPVSVGVANVSVSSNYCSVPKTVEPSSETPNLPASKK